MRLRMAGIVVAALIFLTAARAQDSVFPSVSGWTLTPDSMVYTPDNLYDLIDGAADVYLSYGFVDLHLAEYRRGDGTEVRAELYRHSSPANAFGIYSQERKPDYHFLALGAQGYRDEGVLNFLAGPYYVKISTHASGAGAQRALHLIATAVAAHLKQGSEFPAPLKLFPPARKIANSETYVAENFLGYRALKGAYVARYRQCDMFIIPLSDSTAAHSMLTQYLAAIQQPAGDAGPAGGIVQDPNNGPVGIVLRGNLLAGVVNVRNGGQTGRELARLRTGLGGR